MGKKRVIVGDVFEIPLSDGRRAYGQHVYMDKWGTIIRVFDLVLEEGAEPEQVLERLKDAELLFPPVITSADWAIRTGLWKTIGHMPVTGFAYPGFISYDPMIVSPDPTDYHLESCWRLWNGEIFITLGLELPDEYRGLEFLVVWAPQDVVRRIETGENRYDKVVPKPKTEGARGDVCQTGSVQESQDTGSSLRPLESGWEEPLLDDEAGADEPEEHAVIVHLRLSDDRFGTAKERGDILELLGELEAAIVRKGAGEFDGEEFGQGECILYMYGPDADALFAAVEPVLRASALSAGGWAIKRYGSADDPTAKEEQVAL